MTELLEKAFKEVSKLSETEQNAIAKWLIEELKAEKQWEKSFQESEQILASLADEALKAYKQGNTMPLDIEKL